MFYDFICVYENRDGIETGCNTGCYYENGEHSKKECEAFQKNKKKWGIPMSVRTDQDDLRKSIKTGKGRKWSKKVAAEYKKQLEKVGWF